jgi:pimeloyl-ACP methyl ester carboxylesterase
MPLLFLYGVRRERTAVAAGARPVGEAWNTIFPNASSKNLGNYGHFLQWECPDDVNREVLAFLS